MMHYTIKLPLYVMVSRRTKFYLNMNVYRNAHYMVLDKAKKEFAKIVFAKARRENIAPLKSAVVSYEFFAPDRRRRDLLNVIAVVDKFALDALVSARILPDDNVYRVHYDTICFCGIDRDNPRVEMSVFAGGAA